MIVLASVSVSPLLVQHSSEDFLSSRSKPSSVMAGISLNMYLSKIANAWDAGEGEDLAALISFRDGHVANARLQVAEPEAQVERVLDPPLDEMVAAHVRGCWAWSESDMLEAYKCQTMVVSSFAKLLGNLRLLQ